MNYGCGSTVHPVDLARDPTVLYVGVGLEMLQLAYFCRRPGAVIGAIPLIDYLARLGRAGFGSIEVRARRPYRVLGPEQYATEGPILLESVEICAIKSPLPADGPTVWAGQTAIYFGSGPAFHAACIC